MGGHGGLNILPQKRWNVYNRDNKFKVAQDEEKAREKEQAEQERALNAEREYRHQLLLKRAHGGQQPQQGGAQASGSSQQQEQQAPLQHINFWHEEELNARAQHPEVEAAKKEEARKRGKAEYQTSDPRFDERFQLGYGMGGDKPWYALRGSTLPSIHPDPLFTSGQLGAGKAAGRPALPPAPPASVLPAAGPKAVAGQPGGLLALAIKVAETASTSSSSSGTSSSSSSSSSSDTSSSSNSSSSDDSSSSSSSSSDDSRVRKKRRREHIGEMRKRRGKDSKSSSSRKRRRKESSSSSKKKGKHKKSSSSSSSREGKKERRKQGDAGGVLSIADLRAQRLAREQAERQRERQVLMGALTGGEEQQKGYHSAFGFAAALPKQRGR